MRPQINFKETYGGPCRWCSLSVICVKMQVSFSLVSDVPYIVYVYSDGANAKLRIEDIVRYTINEFAKISSRNVVNTN